MDSETKKRDMRGCKTFYKHVLKNLLLKNQKDKSL